MHRKNQALSKDPLSTPWWSVRPQMTAPLVKPLAALPHRKLNRTPYGNLQPNRHPQQPWPQVLRSWQVKLSALAPPVLNSLLYQTKRVLPSLTEHQHKPNLQQLIPLKSLMRASFLTRSSMNTRKISRLKSRIVSKGNPGRPMAADSVVTTTMTHPAVSKRNTKMTCFDIPVL